MMSFAFSKVTPLDYHNYTQWKLDMELRLTSAGLWPILRDARPAAPNDDWLKNEATVLAGIRHNCSSHARGLIMSTRSAKDAWDLLKARFERNTIC